MVDFTKILPDQTLDRTRQTESMVIGAILIHQQNDSDQLAIVQKAGVGPEDFSTPGLAKIFQTMIDASVGDHGEDFLTAVLRNSHYQDKENQNYLYRLYDEGSTIRNDSLHYHSRALKLLSFERQEIVLVAQLGSKLHQGEASDSIYEELEKIKKEKTDYLRGERNDFGNGLIEWWEAFDHKRSVGFKDQMKIKSHLPSLDEQTQGFRKGEVSVLAGAPGSGKSALALTLILAAVSGSKIKTTLISLEMGLDEIMSRIIVQSRDQVPLKYLLDPTRLQKKNWVNDPNELDRLLAEIEKAREWTERERDVGSFNAIALLSFHPNVVLQSVMDATRNGAEFIVIDHLHRVLFPPKEGNFTESMTRFMVSLTETAKATNSHILVLSQLNRESSREGRKPRLTDLKGSGGIEENTSLAMFLSRELDSSEAELSILKARSGRSGWSIPMIFNPEKIMFGELYN